MEIGYETYVQRLEELCRIAPKSGIEFWMARQIQPVLGYADWRNFEEVIEQARVACDGAGAPVEKHFVATTTMVDIGSGAKRERTDWYLTRQACYLIAMSGDGSKPEIAYAKTYFAVQARRQELQDELTAAEKRLLLRDRVKDANKSLASAAKKSGVQRWPFFQDAGYKGLYGGKGQSDIKAYKGIPENEPLLDCIDRAELAANEFRITQTEQKLTRERIQNEVQAISTHHDVGREVRETIKKIGGTMPEDLPKAPPIKKLLAATKKKKALPRG